MATDEVKALLLAGRYDEVRARTDRSATYWYARFLRLLDDVAELRARALADDDNARAVLVEILAERRDADGLRALADSGYWRAQQQLAALLADAGEVTELRQRAGAGDESAAAWLPRALVRLGELDEVRALAAAGNRSARRALAEWCAHHDATAELRALAEDDPDVRLVLSDLLARQGNLVEATAVARAAEGHREFHAQRQLADLLAKQGLVDELRTRAAGGDWFARQRLIGLSDIDGLRELPYPGAKRRLINLLAAEDRLTDLKELADDDWAATVLGRKLAALGRVDELRDLADAHPAAEYSLVRLLAERGAEAELRTRTSSSAEFALADLLVAQGKTEALRTMAAEGSSAAHTAHMRTMPLADLHALAAAGDREAVYWLMKRLPEPADALRALADAGNRRAASELARHLAQAGDVDELRARATDPEVRTVFYHALATTNLDELRALATDSPQAATVLADALLAQHHLPELLIRAKAGDRAAARTIWTALQDPEEDDDRPDW